MKIIEQRVQVRDFLVKSKLPDSDFVINPYIGCPHACQYCYASFMKRFTHHQEEWGNFIDYKVCDKPISIKRIKGKSVFLSSVTDCYNPFEAKYRITRSILEQLVHADCTITISTKSDLIIRDIDILRKLSNVKIAFSIHTLDDTFRSAMDHGSSIQKRLQAIKILHDAGLHTVLFLSPIFPYLTDWKSIIEATHANVCEYWFENLNLRGDYKKRILSYIAVYHPELLDAYENIYLHQDLTYWQTTEKAIKAYCDHMHLTYTNYFYHGTYV